MQAVFPEQWFGVRERVIHGVAHLKRVRKKYILRFSYSDVDSSPKHLIAEANLDKRFLERYLASSRIDVGELAIPAIAELYSSDFDKYFILLRTLRRTDHEPTPFALIQSTSGLE